MWRFILLASFVDMIVLVILLLFVNWQKNWSPYFSFFSFWAFVYIRRIFRTDFSSTAFRGVERRSSCFRVFVVQLREGQLLCNTSFSFSLSLSLPFICIENVNTGFFPQWQIGFCQKKIRRQVYLSSFVKVKKIFRFYCDPFNWYYVFAIAL